MAKERKLKDYTDKELHDLAKSLDTDIEESMSRKEVEEAVMERKQQIKIDKDEAHSKKAKEQKGARVAGGKMVVQFLNKGTFTKFGVTFKGHKRATLKEAQALELVTLYPRKFRLAK